MKRRFKIIKVEDKVEDKMTAPERRIKEKQDYNKKKQEAFVAKEALKKVGGK